jgi:hypothetical protein
MSRDGIRLVWALLCAYLAAASAICFFGLAGIVRVRRFSLFHAKYKSNHSLPEQTIVRTDISRLHHWRFRVWSIICSNRLFRPTVRSNVCELLSCCFRTLLTWG